jgi:hypothetical protein
VAGLLVATVALLTLRELVAADMADVAEVAVFLLVAVRVAAVVTIQAFARSATRPCGRRLRCWRFYPSGISSR